MKTAFRKSAFIAFFCCLSFFGSATVNAQVNVSEQLNVAKTKLNITTSRTPEEVVGSVIRGVLGLVGIIAFAFFVYAGILWLTSGGEEGKISAAKNILSAAVIGLIIIFTAYALTSFVIDALVKAT